MTGFFSCWTRRLLFVVFLFANVGCGATWEQNQQRLTCLDICADDKDECILNAQTAQQVNRCDMENKWCVQQCQ